MENAFITPIQYLGTVTPNFQIGQTQTTAQTEKSMFKDIFENAINDFKESENNLAHQQFLLATGQLEDAHNLQIAASQAQLTTNMLVQLRNKTLDAYNELMRISV